MGAFCQNFAYVESASSRIHSSRMQAILEHSRRPTGYYCLDSDQPRVSKFPSRQASADFLQYLPRAYIAVALATNNHTDLLYEIRRVAANAIRAAYRTLFNRAEQSANFCAGYEARHYPLWPEMLADRQNL